MSGDGRCWVVYGHKRRPKWRLDHPLTVTVRGVLAVEDPQLRATLRTGLRSGDDYAAVGKPQIDWDDPAALPASG